MDRFLSLQYLNKMDYLLQSDDLTQNWRDIQIFQKMILVWVIWFPERLYCRHSFSMSSEECGRKK